MIYCLNEAKNDSEIIKMLGMSDDISTYQDNIDQEIDDLNEQDFSNTSIKITLTSTENGVEADVEVNTDEDNVGFSISDNGATEKAYVSYDVNDVQFNVEYNNAITFKDVTVTELNDENSVALNDYSQEELSSLLQQLLAQIITVNSQKIQNANVF